MKKNDYFYHYIRQNDYGVRKIIMLDNKGIKMIMDIMPVCQWKGQKGVYFDRSEAIIGGLELFVIAM